MLADQRFFNGPTSAISPNNALPFSDRNDSSVPQTPLSRHHPTPLPNNQVQTPASAIQDGTPATGHRHTSSNNSAMLSPNDPSLQWPLDRVLIWLAANGFSSDWQETFKGLDMHGTDFLDLGRGNGGRGNFGMMHQVVYPRLARECSKSGTGWDQAREREEGKRMRRLVRKIAEGADGGPKPSHGRRESIQILPSASTDGGVENSPNLGRQDGFAATPSTAGGGEDSPGMPFRSPGNALNPRMASKTRSSTAPVPAYAYGNPSSSDPGLVETRTPYTRGILNNINDAASKRHSPSASGETGTAGGPPFLGDAARSSYDASPQSGSPATQHATLAPSTASGTLSAPPYGRPGHKKTNSTDSMASNNAASSTSNLLRGSDRRNGQDGHRPPTLEVSSKPGNDEPPSSAKELTKGFLDRFRKRKKDETSHPSPEDHNLESPTSPLSYYRHTPPTLPFARAGMNNSSTSLDRPESASSKMSEHDRAMRDRAFSRQSGGRRYVLVTPDQWNFRLVDVTEADTAESLRESICRALNYTDHDMAQIYLTEPGQIEHDEPLSDPMLLLSKHSRADSAGTLKLFVRRGPTSASLAPPLSAGLVNGMSPKASPPAGSLFPRKALDEEGYARLRPKDRIRSKSPPLNSRQTTLKGDGAALRDPPRSVESNNDTPNLTRDSLAAGSAKERLQQIKAAGVLADGEWNDFLLAAAEEHRKQNEKKGEAYREGKQTKARKEPSPVDVGSSSIKRDGVINFDTPRQSPYEDRKNEPLVPLRKPPAPPPGSVMLEKANSLSKKTGESLRSSISSQSELAKRRSLGDVIPEEMAERGRRKAVAASPSVSAGIAEAVVEAGNVAGSVGKKIGSRRNMSIRNINDQVNSGRPSPSLQSVGFGQNGSAMNSPGGSPRSPGFTYGKNDMLFKIPDYQEDVADGAESRKPSLALQTQLPKNPSIETLQRAPSPNISPSSQQPPSRKTSVFGRPKSYGPAFSFKESDVQFDQRAGLVEGSDDDSDDGLFAKPLAKIDGKTSSTGDDASVQRRPTLTVDTDGSQRRSVKGRSVTFVEPDTSTNTSAAPSSEGLELDDEGHPVQPPQPRIERHVPDSNYIRGDVSRLPRFGQTCSTTVIC